jgi:hypothetical protein
MINIVLHHTVKIIKPFLQGIQILLRDGRQINTNADLMSIFAWT